MPSSYHFSNVLKCRSIQYVELVHTHFDKYINIALININAKEQELKCVGIGILLLFISLI